MIAFAFDAVTMSLPAILVWFVMRYRARQEHERIRLRERDALDNLYAFRYEAIKLGLAHWVPAPTTGIGRFEFKPINRCHAESLPPPIAQSCPKKKTPATRKK